ncbi:MAG TPA: hypothetical protein VGF28_03520 [Thermoanaerobaculia bacterium]|jgi:hypothetical protein
MLRVLLPAATLNLTLRRRSAPPPPLAPQELPAAKRRRARDPSTRVVTRIILEAIVLAACVVTLVVDLYNGRGAAAAWTQLFLAPVATIDDIVKEAFLARGTWPAESWLAIVFPCVVLPSLAWLFHRLDFERRGGGIRDRAAWLRPPHSVVTSEAISATMTKQSILAAIAAIFLASGEHGSVTSVEFDAFVTGLSRLGFSVALLLLTVSALCYDYANRFRLSDEEKYALVRKGLILDVTSWYVLVASYNVSMAATNVRTSILLSIGTGFLVHWYYFLQPHEFRPRRRRRLRLPRALRAVGRLSGRWLVSR